jgi:hypothetical protein
MIRRAHRVSEPPPRQRPTQFSGPLLFPLGRLLATPGALEAMERAQENPVHLLARHATGDWGEVDAEDRATNDRALETGGRILSVYTLGTGEVIWIVTEAERSATTLLLPRDY